MTFYEKLAACVGAECIRRDEPMSGHTTFRIGGCADYFVEPSGEKGLIDGVLLCARENIDYFIMGNGSNLLVSDRGYRGVIFHICHRLDAVTYEETEDELIVRAGAGVMLSQLARDVSSKGYTGFEYATGIPGTLGGAVTMNAGAYGGEISDNIISARVVDKSGAIKELTRDELNLSYRHSIIIEESHIVLSATFCFAKGDVQAIGERVKELSLARRSKQPLEYPSAGSTFKRPKGYFAGKLIEDMGLKGYRVGGAMVSEKHAGFVINAGGASAEDVMAVIKHVQDVVEKNYPVKMETEIRLLGEF